MLEIASKSSSELIRSEPSKIQFVGIASLSSSIKPSIFPSGDIIVIL